LPQMEQELIIDNNGEETTTIQYTLVVETRSITVTANDYD